MSDCPFDCCPSGEKCDKKKWKRVKYDFATVLGTSHGVTVEVWDTDEEGIYFRPGEEERLERRQAERYLALVLDKKIEPTELEIKHLKRVLGIYA